MRSYSADSTVHKVTQTQSLCEDKPSFGRSSHRRLWIVPAVIMLMSFVSGVSANADVHMTGRLVRVSGARLVSPLPSGKVNPFSSTSINGDYRCEYEYSVVANAPYYFAIGNCKAGWELEAVTYASENSKHEHSYGGFVNNAYSGCGWIDTRFPIEKLNNDSNSACAGSGSGRGFWIEESSFWERYDKSNEHGDGNWVVNSLPCPEYANYRPWSTNNVEKELIRTAPAYALGGEGLPNEPAIKWRYVTKYASTDGTGKYVMVRDTRITGAGEGNWVFVPLSCLRSNPSELPETGNERLPPAPAVATESVTNLQTPSVTLNGSVNPEGIPAHYYFQYGKTTSFEAETSLGEAGSGTTSVKESASVSGLAAGTTYYYRIVAYNGRGSTYGQTWSFTTQPPPEVITTAASGVQQNQATLNGNVNPKELDTHYDFEYGKTASYDSSTTSTDVGSGTSSVPVSSGIGSLEANTTYHYRIVASNSAGTSYGSDAVFTTELTHKAASVETSTGEQYAYYRGLSNGLHYWYWNDKEWTEHSLGENSAMAGEPVPISREHGAEQYIWYHGTDGRLHFWYLKSGKWSENYLGETGAMAGQPVSLLRANGEQYIYYRGSDGGLHYWYWNDKAWTLHNLGTSSAMAGEPVAVLQDSTGEQYVWYRGTDGRLHFWYLKSEKWSENYLGATNALAGEPVTALRENGEQYVYYRGSDGGLHYWYWNDKEWTLHALGTSSVMAGEPVLALLRLTGEQYVWYRGTDGRLDFWYLKSEKWSENYLGAASSMAGEPVSVLREDGEQYVWYRGSEGRLRFWYWNDKEWSENYLGTTEAMGGEPVSVLLANGEQYLWYGSTEGRLTFWYWNDKEWGLNWLGSTWAL